jgi:hypothetical protein
MGLDGNALAPARARWPLGRVVDRGEEKRGAVQTFVGRIAL